jgi:cell division protein ZapA
MTILNLEINKRDYEIACSDGEEEHLKRLSYELDKRVRELAKGVGTGNQSTLLVFAALQMLDEIYDLRYGDKKGQVSDEVDKVTSLMLSQVSDKIENIAAKLEKKVG